MSLSGGVIDSELPLNDLPDRGEFGEVVSAPRQQLRGDRAERGTFGHCHLDLAEALRQTIMPDEREPSGLSMPPVVRRWSHARRSSAYCLPVAYHLLLESVRFIYSGLPAWPLRC